MGPTDIRSQPPKRVLNLELAHELLPSRNGQPVTHVELHGLRDPLYGHVVLLLEVRASRRMHMRRQTNASPGRSPELARMLYCEGLY